MQRLSLYRKPRFEINFVLFADEILKWEAMENFMYKDARVKLKHLYPLLNF